MSLIIFIAYLVVIMLLTIKLSQIVRKLLGIEQSTESKSIRKFKERFGFILIFLFSFCFKIVLDFYPTFIIRFILIWFTFHSAFYIFLDWRYSVNDGEYKVTIIRNIFAVIMSYVGLESGILWIF